MLWFQNMHKTQLEEYLIFYYNLPSALLEQFVFKKVMGKQGLPQWGRGLITKTYNPSLLSSAHDFTKPYHYYRWWRQSAGLNSPCK